jgi:hypothetical protein
VLGWRPMPDLSSRARLAWAHRTSCQTDLEKRAVLMMNLNGLVVYDVQSLLFLSFV